MVRSGEYSPNYPGNSNAYGGIVGLGGYEEKRKLLNEQRKLEYKEYVSHLAQKKSSDLKKRAQEAATYQKLNGNATYSKKMAEFYQKDVSTQTERCELRDAWTTTCQHDMRHEKPEYVASVEKMDAVYRREKSYDRDILCVPMPSRKETTPRSRRTKTNLDLREKPTYLNGEEGITFGGRDQKLCVESPASYERCLLAQIEDKRRMKSEQKDIERIEDEGRVSWASGEATKELERQRVIAEKTRAVEDLRKQRNEEFLYRSEEFHKEAVERRKIKMSNIAAENAASVKESAFENTVGSQTEDSKLFKSKRTPKNASDFLKLASSRDSIKDSSHNSTVPKHMSVTSEYQGLPNRSARINDESLNLTSEKSFGSPSVLTQLGEIRRQLVTEQLKMEEAVQKTNLHN